MMIGSRYDDDDDDEDDGGGGGMRFVYNNYLNTMYVCVFKSVHPFLLNCFLGGGGGGVFKRRVDLDERLLDLDARKFEKKEHHSIIII